MSLTPKITNNPRFIDIVSQIMIENKIGGARRCSISTLNSKKDNRRTSILTIRSKLKELAAEQEITNNINITNADKENSHKSNDPTRRSTDDEYVISNNFVAQKRSSVLNNKYKRVSILTNSDNHTNKHETEIDASVLQSQYETCGADNLDTERVNFYELPSTKRFLHSRRSSTADVLFKEKPRNKKLRRSITNINEHSCFNYLKLLVHQETRTPDQVMLKDMYMNFKMLEFATALFTLISNSLGYLGIVTAAAYYELEMKVFSKLKNTDLSIDDIEAKANILICIINSANVLFSNIISNPIVIVTIWRYICHFQIEKVYHRYLNCDLFIFTKDFIFMMLEIFLSLSQPYLHLRGKIIIKFR
jgi:hypothetical protein